MSAAQSNLPGADTPATPIVHATTPNDILVAAEQVPELAAVLDQVYNLAKTPVGSLIGMVLAWGAGHFGFTIPPDYVPLICGGGILLGHYSQTTLLPLVKGWWKARQSSSQPDRPV